MNAILTPKQMAESMLKILENSVTHIPEDKREEAKSRILDAFGKSMFYSGGKIKNDSKE